MYVLVLFLHSWLRYVVLGLGLALLFFAIRALRGGAWKPAYERTHAAFVGSLDLQLLLGLVMLFSLSPIATAALSDFGGAMKDPQLRFWGVEHPVAMLLAVVVAHIGRARSKRAPSGVRPRTLVWTQALWLALTLAAIPWPGLDVGRPLWRGL